MYESLNLSVLRYYYIPQFNFTLPTKSQSLQLNFILSFKLIINFIPCEFNLGFTELLFHYNPTLGSVIEVTTFRSQAMSNQPSHAYPISAYYIFTIGYLDTLLHIYFSYNVKWYLCIGNKLDIFEKIL